MKLLLLIGSFGFGYITFPILFYIQRLFRLPMPDLTREKVHIHHSFYGLIILLVGIFLLFVNMSIGVICIGIGTGFIIHHEVSEPGLVGIEKFIYIKRHD